MALNHSDVVVNGVRSPVLQAGPTDASEAVVFVHGNPGTATDWTFLLEPVGSFARGVALDMPGFGEADKPKDFTYTVDGYAAHLAAALDQLGITRAHLVAHDFGGPWALTWAATHPESFASATLVNTGVLVDYSWHQYAKIWRTPVLGEAFMATATKSMFRLLLGRENPGLSRVALDGIYEQSKARGTKRAVLKLYRATPADHMGALKDKLAQLDRPAMVVWGADDAYIPVAQAELQRMSFPSAEVHELAGLGHWPMFEAPEAVADLVVPFLRKQLA